MVSPDHEQHAKHLAEVLARLRDHGLVLNVENCQLGVGEVNYLGHWVTATGIKPLADRVAAIGVLNGQSPQRA